ncbi:hypothetical protein [Acinetobacter sp.]|uniref:hypothetical protein n=1 Tax=Acinetobacter sp. TaxID=472 RepID=UPI0029136AF9|nr:hypothetical protein [Acinetobacter sp.]MDU4032422.1 hypothetical protein [Acinetobacter sp.]
MKDQELELLLGICRVIAKRFIDMAEFHTYPKQRVAAEYEIRLAKVGLCCVPFGPTSKRIRIAKNLDKAGLVTLSQFRKGGTWDVKFTSLDLSQKIYDMALKSVEGFEFHEGKHWVSYPQFSKTSKGFSEVERLGQMAFEVLKESAA